MKEEQSDLHKRKDVHSKAQRCVRVLHLDVGKAEIEAVSLS
jgi:hypothetical protein